jgi:hypothetical protein
VRISDANAGPFFRLSPNKEGSKELFAPIHLWANREKASIPLTSVIGVTAEQCLAVACCLLSRGPPPIPGSSSRAMCFSAPRDVIERAPPTHVGSAMPPMFGTTLRHCIKENARGCSKGDDLPKWSSQIFAQLGERGPPLTGRAHFFATPERNDCSRRVELPRFSTTKRATARRCHNEGAFVAHLADRKLAQASNQSTANHSLALSTICLNHFAISTISSGATPTTSVSHSKIRSPSLVLTALT